jgi:hypothetical protein
VVHRIDGISADDPPSGFASCEVAGIGRRLGAPQLLTTMASELDLLALRDLPEVRGLLLASGAMRLRIVSGSMRPTLRAGDEIAVQPAAVVTLRAGELIVFQVGSDIVCHRVTRASDDAVWTRAETAGSLEHRVAPAQVLGRVVAIRPRGCWIGIKTLLHNSLTPVVHRWLGRLQAVPVYRAVMRRLVAPGLSYHLGLARGAVRYEWLELGTGAELPVLSRESRPHVLLGRRRQSAVGWSVLVFRDSAWRCESLYVRLRYRGLGIERELSRLTRLVLETR